MNRFVTKTHEQYCEEIKNKNIIPIEKYSGSKTKIMHKCLVCGNEWKTTPGHIIAGGGCPECTKKRIKLSKTKTHEQYCDDLKRRGVINVIPVEKYIDDSTKIMHKCLVCGTEWKIKPNDVLHKHGCPKCAMERRVSNLKVVCNIPAKKSFENAKSVFIEKVNKISNNTIEVLDEYIGVNKKIRFRCKKCGLIWEAKPNDILTGYGCKNCNHVHSRGERKILKFLRLHNIYPEMEKSFEGLIGLGGGLLRFDFYLSEYNLLIEFQGKQHYMVVKRFGGKKGFEQRKIHDQKKRDFCKEHNIKELEISYLDFKNIDSILSECLSIS